MKGSNSRKIKLLKIWEILNRDTDVNNPMSTPVLIEKLSECGIEVDRKILYSDIKLLNNFGYVVRIQSGFIHQGQSSILLKNGYAILRYRN